MYNVHVSKNEDTRKLW